MGSAGDGFNTMKCTFSHFLQISSWADVFHFQVLTPSKSLRIGTERGIFSLKFLFSFPRLVLDWMGWDVNFHFFLYQITLMFPTSKFWHLPSCLDLGHWRFFFFHVYFLMVSVGVGLHASGCTFLCTLNVKLSCGWCSPLSALFRALGCWEVFFSVSFLMALVGVRLNALKSTFL